VLVLVVMLVGVRASFPTGAATWFPGGPGGGMAGSSSSYCALEALAGSGRPWPVVDEVAVAALRSIVVAVLPRGALKLPRPAEFHCSTICSDGSSLRDLLGTKSD